MQQMNANGAQRERASVSAAARLSFPQFGRAGYYVDDDPTAGQNPPYGACDQLLLEDCAGRRREDQNRGRDRANWCARSTGRRPPASIASIGTCAANKQKKCDCAPARPTRLKFAIGADGWRARSRGRSHVYTDAAGNLHGQTFGRRRWSRVSRLVVRKDPNSAGTEADINTQMAMLFELRKDLESAADMVNQIEVIRSQLGTITALLNTGTAGVCPIYATRSRKQPMISIRN